MNEQIIEMLTELIKTGGTEASKVILLYRFAGVLEGVLTAVAILGGLIILAKIITGSIYKYSTRLENFYESELLGELRRREKKNK